MIRKAEPSDSTAVAKLMIQAMEEVISKMTGATDPYAELALLEHFIRLPDNQYSYQNTIVAEVDHEVCGSLTAYDGARLKSLRDPIFKYLKIRGLSIDGIDNETEEGEFYIDTISVAPQKQGSGIGTELLKAGIQSGKSLRHRYIGLLVNPDNPKAQKFYERMGFKEQGIRQFLGISYIHMVFDTSIDG